MDNVIRFIIRYLTFLGNIFPQFCICCVLLVIDFKAGYQVGSLWFWGYALNLLFKNSIRKERPPREDWLVPNVHGTSFPSGHSLVSLVLYWSIAKYFNIELPLALLFYFMPIALGLSRLYLRVHYIEDVIGGWLIAYMYLHFFEDSVLRFQEIFYGVFYKLCHLLI